MAKSNIYIFTYNNYFNRIIKKEDTLQGYGTPKHTLIDTNFDYADGVKTSHVFNYSGEGDYLIVTDSENNIKHRWFIIENKKTRGGQYQFQLRRDLIVDYYDLVVNAPMVINRAMISDPNSALLFNNEGFSFNQIKKDEFLINDESDTRWYYLYFKHDAPEKDISVDISEEIGYSAYDATIATTAANYFTIQDQDVSNIVLDSFTFRTMCHYNTAIYEGDPYNWRFSSSLSSQVVGFPGNDGVYSTYHRLFLEDTIQTVDPTVRTLLANNYSTLKSSFFTDRTDDLVTDQQYNDWTALDGKRVKDSNNKIYRVTVAKSITSDTAFIQTTNYPSTRTRYESMITGSGLDYTGGLGTEALRVNFTKRTVNVHLEEITGQEGQINFKLLKTPSGSDYDYVETKDSDYKIIAIPADVCSWYAGTTSGYKYTSPVIMQKVLRAISLAYSEDQLVDIQLLPYCPYISIVRDTTVYPLDLSITQVQYLTHDITEGQTTVEVKDGFIFYVDKANFSFNIYGEYHIGNYSTDPALNKKIANEVELWRLVSPNYNGIFEFSMAKNDGVNYFNVDISLKPYNPYIHINPNFKSLYGQDWDDATGLVLNGDFSLPKESSQWVEYELRNKNYELAFNRQIEHMDFTHQQERVKAAFGIFSGSASGAAMGALAGSAIGGPIGAGIGAAVGGISSGIGGIADYVMMGDRQREDKDLAIDNFKYQLGNIKALPNTLSKVTPLTYNNKKFPFLEKYTCTDEEVEILKNKIKYNSMTVNAIGTIVDYQLPERTFISGLLIRLEGSGLANNELFELYDELKKGVYI